MGGGQIESKDVVRRRRMVRAFDQRAVPQETLTRVLDIGRRAPSAGFSQGFACVVLDRLDQTARFWSITEHPDFPWEEDERGARPPNIVLPLSHKEAYFERYSKPDKIKFGLNTDESWPIPYWHTDTASWMSE
ncbi:MAG: nitroreductase family protein [Gaiellaceae bacterium]